MKRMKELVALRIRFLVGAALLAAQFFVTPAASAIPMFMRLGDLPGGDFESTAFAVSADGTTVVGRAHTPPGVNGSTRQAFRWTQATGMVSLYEQPGDFHPDGTAYGVSGDGSLIVGQSDINASIEPILWTADGGIRLAVDPDLERLSGSARGASDDGSTIVGGYGNESGRSRAFVSNRTATETIFLGTLNDYDGRSLANGINADGTHVVGWSATQNGAEAFLWTQAAGMIGLGNLIGGGNISEAYDVSDDGSIIVGRADSDLGRDAFRWTNETGMLSLNDDPRDVTARIANAVSGDGSVIVGFGTNTSDTSTAFIWDEASGVRSLQDVLSSLDLDLEGWTLQEAQGISADGLTIVGWGINPDGFKEAWVATVPEPGTGLLVAFGLVALARKR